jgi:DNA-binding transcriptional LysR family regulator
MDRLTATQVFVEVADRSSLTAAAEHLEMSTAMVSRYLGAIESWFDARLLHRTTRKVTLTDAGIAALPACRQLLELAADAHHLAAERTREPAGLLRITSAGSFAETQLTPSLIAFQQRYPKIEIALTVADKTTDLVADRVDLAIRITNHLAPTLIARPLALCRSVLCASPLYLAKYGQPTELDDLARHRCISHAFGAGASYRFLREQNVVEVPVQWSFHTNETAILRRAVLSGGGIGMLPTYYIGDDLTSGRLVRLLPAETPETFGIYAAYLSRQHQPLALRLLVDFLAERFSGVLPPWDLEEHAPFK